MQNSSLTFLSSCFLILALTLFSNISFSQTNPEQPKFIQEDSEIKEPATETESTGKQKKEKKEKPVKVRSDDYMIDDPGFSYEDKTYDKDIKTIIFHKEGFDLNPPIIGLGNVERLVVRFDDLNPELRTYAYTIEHCTHDWKSSGLIESEYIQGFYMDYINDYRNSFNTYLPYVHHTFTFPNENMRLLRSGNYLLKVYHDSNPNKIIFTRRFMVADTKVGISAQVIAPRNVSVRNEGQEVNFTINHSSYPIANPYGDLQVVMLQNNQWSTAITGLKPVFVKDRDLVYDYDLPATFMAGNEYRFIDIKSFTYQMDNILRIERSPEGFEVLLRPEEKRTFKRHLTQDDINGKFLIKNDDGFADHTESNYAKVHFALALESPLIQSGVYVYGGFNGYQLGTENRMIYDETVRAYKATILMKQGYYNYQYVVVDPKSTKPDLTRLEGSHRDTSNDYLILVYHRNFSDNYDQLIGLTYVYSNRR
jgi:hypothetical protein